MMIPWLILAAVPSSDVDFERVTSDRLSEHASLLVPLSTRMLDGRFGVRFSSTLHLDGDLRRGIPMNVTVPFGFEGTSLLFHIPWVMKIDDPLFRDGAMGNFGISVHTSLVDEPDHRLGVLTDISINTTSANSARALAFTFDIPRYAPNTHTFSLGAGSVFLLSELVAGANAGGALHLNVDPLGPNNTDGSLWLEAWVGAPLVADQQVPGFWIAPLLEANATSTWSWRGAVTDVAFTAGLTVSVADEQFSDTHDHRTRMSLSAGYQIGTTDERRVDRLIVTFDFGFILDRALYRRSSPHLEAE